MTGRMLTAVGPALRQGGIALRWRWVHETERQRDDARGIAQALLVEARTRDADLQRVLRTAGHGHLADRAHDDLPQAVDEAIAAERQRLDRAQAERNSALDAVGRVAAALNLPGAPQRWNIETIMERVAALDRRADRAAELVTEVAAWVASITGEHPDPDVPLVDAVRRAAVVNAATLRDEVARVVGAAPDEVARLRDVLAPDVDTTGTPLDEAARAALASARATAAAAELRWWASQRYLERETLRARAEHLDPSGTTPDADEPPTPTIFRAGDEPRVPRRAAAGLAANLARAVREAAQQRDAKAGHPDEVLAALKIADAAWSPPDGTGERGGSYARQMGALTTLARAVRAHGEQPDDVVDATIACGERVGGRICSLPEDHEGDHVPSWTVLDTEQVAREAAHQAVVDGGVERERAPEVVDALARAGFVPGVYPPGMAIDGDMLRSLITDALPRWATDEFAGELADSVLDAAVRAGFTILHGTKLAPRPPAEPEQHWAEHAIERAREYLISLGYESIVDDHGEDVASMLRETLGVLRDRAARVGSPANGGIFEISRERTEQQADHGHTLQRDDRHVAGELARAAQAYLVSTPTYWPRAWGAPPHFPDHPVERLAKAGALIAAEIDRLRRAENRAATAEGEVPF